MRAFQIAVLLTTAITAADKKSAPITYPTTATVDGPCSKVWATVISVYFDKGFGPRQAGGTSKEAGIIDFEYRRGVQLAGYFGNVNQFVRDYTIRKTNSMSTYKGFRVESATALLVDDDGRCSVTAKHAYAGFEKRMAGARWWIVESNGKMESEILTAIEAKHQTKK